MLLFAHPDFEDELRAECMILNLPLEPLGQGLFKSSLKHNGSFVWARDIWDDCEIVEFDTVSKAVSQLREISKLPWRQVTCSSHRRGELIEQAFSSKAKILKLRAKKTGWPGDVSRSRRQPSFLLLSPNNLVACASPRDEAPGGAWGFNENRDEPPSRAYLKLWEWGWRTEVLPQPGEVALDLGASPGGWTWVLAKAGLTVHAFDRSPLKLKLPLAIEKRVHFSKADAFQVIPEAAPVADWVFCDVIAAPQRTLELIEAWLPTNAGLVFTIKFKGETDFDAIARLQSISGGFVRHLDVNKHEVTFWRHPVLK